MPRAWGAPKEQIELKPRAVSDPQRRLSPRPQDFWIFELSGCKWKMKSCTQAGVNRNGQALGKATPELRESRRWAPRHQRN